jgi:hypothetical protein
MTKQKYEVLDEWHDKAEEFSKRFASAKYESGQAQNFMRNFCEIFGVDTYSSIQFEDKINLKKADALLSGINRIDGFLPGMLLIEMKSGGKDLTKAGEQAFRYIRLLEMERPEVVPDYVMVSDFQTIDLYDKNVSEIEPTVTIKLSEFRNHLETFAFLAGYKYIVEQRQEAVNIKAAEKLADLHESIKQTGYSGKDLETLLVRTLFCLFAEDTGLFATTGQFTTLINSTNTNGYDLSGALDMLFISLDASQRHNGVYEYLRAFPYVNGDLFKGRIEPCYFTSEARTALLACAAEIDWSQISPSIFGSLFQAIMHFDDNDVATKSKKRREFGAHYTSENNILKVIAPLFLDKLKKELKDCKGEVPKLEAYLKRLRQIRIFDPACGCGNFLVVAYREIRMLEEAALKQLAHPKKGQAALFENPLCNVNQCYGIEIDSAAAQIATLALWLVDHQMNMRFETIDKTPYRRLPLTAKANIVCSNALQLDWNSVIPAKDCSYLIGNPPFIGAKFMNEIQRSDILSVCTDIKNYGLLDYVSGWYVKAAHFIKGNPDITVAFVSTNSITQGEQVGVLWKWMLDEGIKIHFAHRTFRWGNEGKGVAAVHCVIIGFGLSDPKQRVIFDYAGISGEPEKIRAKNISPYLVDAPSVTLINREKPLCKVPEIGIGNKPIDGGRYLFTTEEKTDFLKLEPKAEKWFRRWLGADEFINGYERWCLWLGDCPADELSKMPEAIKRVEAVRQMRLESKSVPTQKLAEKPTRFHVENMPKGSSLLIPEVSSSRRSFVPIGFIEPTTLCSNLVKLAPNATLYHFGIITSTMHNAWVRAVCGRMKSDYRYSSGIVYNNFPWPEKPTKELNDDVEAKAQNILDVRKSHNTKTLADLYNPETMPAELCDAHKDLDDAVDACYGYTGKKDDASRVAFLFRLYGDLVKGN